MPHFLYFSEGISFRIFPSFFFLNRELLFDSQHIFEKKQKLLSLKLNCSFLDIQQLLFLPKLQVGLKYLICFLKYDTFQVYYQLASSEQCVNSFQTKSLHHTGIGQKQKTYHKDPHSCTCTCFSAHCRMFRNNPHQTAYHWCIKHKNDGRANNHIALNRLAAVN